MASYQPPVFNRSLVAASDLSSSQFLYVKNNGSDKAAIAGGATGELGAGFLMNQPELNQICEIATIGGGAKGIAAGTITVHLELKNDATGKMVEADTAGDIVVAIANEAAVSGDTFSLTPVYYRKHA